MVFLAAFLTLTCFVRQGSATTFSDLYSGGGGSYSNIYNDEVTGVLNVYSNGAETFVVSDSTASVVFYDNLLTFSNGTRYSPAAGDRYSDITSLTNAGFQNSPQVSGFYFTGFSTGNAVAVPVLTTAQVDAAGNGTRGVPPYSESIVTLDNVYFHSGTIGLAGQSLYTITDPYGSATVFTNTNDSAVLSAVVAVDKAETASGDTLLSGPVDITAYINPYNGVSQLYPLSITAAVPEPVSLGILICGGASLLRRRPN